MVDNEVDERAPYALLDPDDVVVKVGQSTRALADWAFDQGADEVRHDEDLLSDSRFTTEES